MIAEQMTKTVVGLAPISLNSGAGTALTVDTAGYAYATWIITLGVVGGAATVFKLQESESDFSGADVTGFVASGSTGNLRLPQTGDAGKVFMYQVALGGTRKRYQQFQITTGATTLVSIVCLLSRAEQVPNTATARGLGAIVIG